MAQLLQAPGMISALQGLLPEDDDAARLERIKQNILASQPSNAGAGTTPAAIPAATPATVPTPTPAAPITPAQPSESARLSSQLEKMNQPKSLKELVANAALSFAPTAIAGLAGGLPAAAGAAHGVTAELSSQKAEELQQKKSLLEQVEAAKQREERMAEHQLTAKTAEQGHQERLQGINATNALREQIEKQRNERQTAQGNQGNVTALRKLGLDAQGNPIPREQLTPAEQSKLDVADSLEELRAAQAEVARTRNDPNSPMFKMAQQRLSLAQNRLSLSQQQTESRLFGTNNGVPLPGALITDSGQTVGSSYSQNVRPTGTQRARGDMASSAREQLSDIVSIVQRHPTLFGPGYGQTTEFKNWLGSTDPDAKAFVAARTIAGDHLAGTFGGRSEPALNQLDAAIGQFKENPQAMLAGIQQLDKAAKLFEDRGTPRTVGSAVGKGKSNQPGIIKYDKNGNRQ